MRHGFAVVLVSGLVFWWTLGLLVVFLYCGVGSRGADWFGLFPAGMGTAILV